MSTKSDLVNALRDDGQVADLLEKIIPTLAPNSGAITDTESAIMRIAEIEQAIYNGIIVLFSDVAIFDFMLRGMQRTPQLTALTMLQLRSMSGTYALEVSSPLEGITYVGCLPCLVFVGESVVKCIAVSSWGAVSLVRGSGFFELTFPVALGSYDVRFIATDALGKQQATTVSGVIIEDFSVTPADQSTPETVSMVTINYAGDVSWVSATLEIAWSGGPSILSLGDAVQSAGQLLWDVASLGLNGVCEASASLQSSVLGSASKAWSFIAGGE